jgi:ribosome-binding protein aMBF1 (putative translation factor)
MHQDFKFTKEHETDAGLPNTCSVCGKDPGATWYARNRDEARSGLGVCKDCAFPKAGKSKKAEKAEKAEEQAEVEQPEQAEEQAEEKPE